MGGGGGGGLGVRGHAWCPNGCMVLGLGRLGCRTLQSSIKGRRSEEEIGACQKKDCEAVEFWKFRV